MQSFDMPNDERKAHFRSKRTKYDKIESDTRRKLLYMVKDLKISIKEAAQFLNVNYSTSKTILQLYRRTGRIDRLERKYLLQLQIERQSEIGFSFYKNPLSLQPFNNLQTFEDWKLQTSLPQCHNGQLFQAFDENQNDKMMSTCCCSNESTPQNTQRPYLQCIPSCDLNLSPSFLEDQDEDFEKLDMEQMEGPAHFMTSEEIEREGMEAFFSFRHYTGLIYKKITPGIDIGCKYLN